MPDRHRARFNCGEQGSGSWHRRAQACVDLLARLPVRPGPDDVLADLGCGDQKLRETMRARGLAVAYQGYDLHPQSNDVVAFDVRTDALPKQHHVAVLLGVVEYLPDFAAVLQRLAQQVPFLVFSHVVREHSRYTPEQLAELGWINHLTTTELERALDGVGLDVIDRQSTADHRNLVLLCRRRESSRARGSR
jgi:hypothetical protein